MTYSIVGRDATTGDLGVAVQSHLLCAGARVVAAEPGVGVLALQSFAPASFGRGGIALLRDGTDSDRALGQLLGDDERTANRSQVAILGLDGPPAAHTGAWCVGEAGHAVGDHASAQANMVRTPGVWHDMLNAFGRTTGDLALRLLAALDAAEAAGGDWRGQQAAALCVVTGGSAAAEVLVDLRVDDHPQALAELHRLYRMNGAAQRMREAFTFARDGRIEEAVAELDAAQEVYGPGNAEPTAWSAVLLLRAGRHDLAGERLQQVVGQEGWTQLVRRLPAARMLPVSDAVLDAVLPSPTTEAGRSSS